MSSIKDCAVRFSKQFGVVGNTAPTDASVRIVSERLGFDLPSDYVEFAKLCPAYASWLLSIGEDYDDPCHILKNNEWHHTPKNIMLPPELVIINHGYDGDLDCYDLSQKNAQNQISICYCETLESKMPEITPGSKRHLAFTLSEYLTLHLDAWEKSRADSKT